MKKFLIAASGIYLALVGVLAGVFCLLSFTSEPRLSAQQQALFNAAKVPFVIISVVFVLWLVGTGTGIICKKNWARFSIFIMSGCAIAMGLFNYLSLFLGPVSLNEKNIYETVRPVFLALNSFFFIIIPVFFLVLFSQRSIKQLFLPETGDMRQSPRPFGITLIALFALFGSLSLLFLSFQFSIFRVPLVANLMLTGNAVKVFYFISALVFVYIGIGLLKLRKGAWLSAIFVESLLLLTGVINIFTISEVTLSQIISPFGSRGLGMTLANYKVISSIGLIFPLAILIYLFSKRNLWHPRQKKS